MRMLESAMRRSLNANGKRTVRPGLAAKKIPPDGPAARSMRRGLTLYYRGPSRVMRVTLSPALDVVKRDSLFLDTMDRSPSAVRRNWDLMPNGREFVMVQWASTDKVSVVVNWPRLIARGK